MQSHLRSSLMLLVCGIACASCTASPDGSVATASVSAAAASVGRGMIVPAYVALSDTATWNVLKENAATMASGAQPKDYWVVANGPNNGPFTTTAEWAAGAAVWD